MKIENIILEAESRNLEFKEKLPRKADLNKTIISFANDAGGLLIIGIKDHPRKIVGVDQDDLLLIEEKISTSIHDNCSPIILPDISFRRVQDKYIVLVQISKGNHPPYFLKNKGESQGTYIRVGSSNRAANQEVIEELHRKRSNISFDSLPVYDKPAEELVFTDFKKHFFEKTKEELTTTVLRKLNLIELENKQSLPTTALVLLSNDELKNKLFPYSKIECARFKGNTPGDFIDQKTIDGALSLQAEEAYQFILRHVSKGSFYEGVYRNDRWEFPIIALREVIRNAVIHRDYSLTGKDIKIAVFDRKIEITSPGNLLPSIDFNDMEAGQSDIRNRTLAPVFKRMGIIEQWGNGLKLISDNLKDYPEIEFQWKQPGMSFRAIFTNHERQQNKEYLSQTDVEKKKQSRTITDDYGRLRTITDDYKSLSLEKRKILLYLSDHDRITRKEAMEVVSMQKSKTFEILNELVNQQLIVSRGRGRGTHYILKKKNHE